MRVLNATQMREADRHTITELGIGSAVLMENAGQQVVAAMRQRWPTLDDQRVSVVCGKGNNGGDGFVVARILDGQGVDVRVYVAAAATEIGGDAGANLSTVRELGVPVVDVSESVRWDTRHAEIAASDLIVDALFGTGLTRPLEGHWRTIVVDLNETGVPIVAVDVPSGVSTDSATSIGEAIQATLTVTFAALKLPLVVTPVVTMAGEVVVADIGIPETVVDNLTGPRVSVVDRSWVASRVPRRDLVAHKGVYGRVLIVAGATGKTGAAALAARGALRSGAGLVTVATPRRCQATVAALMPEFMTIGLEDSPEGTVRAEAADAVLAERCDVLAVGPGLGRGEDVGKFVRAVVERATTPVVCDADAIHALAGGLDEGGNRDHAIVLTPHAGEMAKLLGETAEYVQSHRIDVARRVATSSRVFVVLKGARTVIATPTGDVFVNLTGNPGLATGGTGDVLTGVVAAWMAQLTDTATACGVGVYLHGLAGDLAAARHSPVAMIASDLADHLGDAVRALDGPKPTELFRHLPHSPVNGTLSGSEEYTRRRADRERRA